MKKLICLIFSMMLVLPCYSYADKPDPDWKKSKTEVVSEMGEADTATDYHGFETLWYFDRTIHDRPAFMGCVFKDNALMGRLYLCDESDSSNTSNYLYFSNLIHMYYGDRTDDIPLMTDALITMTLATGTEDIDRSDAEAEVKNGIEEGNYRLWKADEDTGVMLMRGESGDTTQVLLFYFDMSALTT